MQNIMTDLKYLYVVLTVVTIADWKRVIAEKVEACNGETFMLSCHDSEIIIINSAEYGRKEVGRCIQEADQFMGCTNDVLPLLDRWCSGRRDCSFQIPNRDLEKENTNCLKILRLYVEVRYTCMKVDSRCKSNDHNIHTETSGYMTSYQVDTKACGLKNSPWLITAAPGQTITLTMTDFSAKSNRSNLASCPTIYGSISEKALGITHSICGGRQRLQDVYTSKTNTIEMYFQPKSQRHGGQFLIEYEITGCPELIRPINAWYKREGNLAVIGCEANDKEWHLTCVGNKWVGEIGNCTNLVEVVPSVKTAPHEMKFSSVVVMTAIAGVAVVLCVISIVIGAVYVHKYKLRQETIQLKKIYDEAERNTAAYYGNRTLTLDHVPPYSDQCTCATLPARSETTKTLHGSREERQSLYSSIKST